jgi:putative aldouronate transport system permease protein
MKYINNKNYKLHIEPFRVINGLFLIIIAFITLYPMWHILIVSLSSGEFIVQKQVKMLPKGITPEAYTMVFQNEFIWTAYKNTFIYTFLGTFINIVLTALCAYPLSRKDLYGRKPITFFIILTMFISGGMIPLYLVINNLKMIDTIWAIVLPPAISTYNMIIMRTSFAEIPESIQESAYIDGANDFQILWKIIVPLSKPVLATLTLFYAVQHWNSYFPAMLYLNTKEKYPVQIFLRDVVITGELSDQSADMASHVNIISTNYKYAVIIISVIPILLIYPYLQKYFAKGVMIGAVKG